MGDLTGGTTLPRTSLSVALRGHLWEGVQASPGPALDSGLSLWPPCGLPPASSSLVFLGPSRPAALGHVEDQKACSPACSSAPPLPTSPGSQALLLSSAPRLPPRPSPSYQHCRPSRGLGLYLSEHLFFHPDGILSLSLIRPGTGNHVSLMVQLSSAQRGQGRLQGHGTDLSSTSSCLSSSFAFLFLLSLPPSSPSSSSSFSSQLCLDTLPSHSRLPGPGPCLSRRRGRSREDFSYEEVPEPSKTLRPPPATGHKVSCFED